MLGLIGNIFKTEKKVPEKIDRLIQETKKELKEREKEIYWYSISKNDLKTYSEFARTWTNEEKLDLILYATSEIEKVFLNNQNPAASENLEQARILEFYLFSIFKSDLDLEDDGIFLILNSFINFRKSTYLEIFSWPIQDLIKLIQKKYLNSTPPERIRNSLIRIKSELKKKNSYNAKAKLKLSDTIEEILFKSENPEGQRPILCEVDDNFGEQINSYIECLGVENKKECYQILALAKKGNNNTPPARIKQNAQVLLKSFGEESFTTHLLHFLEFLYATKNKIETHTYVRDRQYQTYTTQIFLGPSNLNLAKGLIWISLELKEDKNVLLLEKIAERAYKKIPGKGSSSLGLGNTCLSALYQIGTFGAINQLSRLKLKIKQNQTQTLISQYLNILAREKGITPEEIEDLSVQDFGLKAGKIHFTFGKETGILELNENGDIKTHLFKDNGKEIKSIPEFWKKNFPKELKEFKIISKQIETDFQQQRNRLDRMFRSKREMSYSHFQSYFFHQEILQKITRKLIWNFSDETKKIPALYFQNKWITLNEEEFIPNEQMKINLWHPAEAGLEEIQNWREFLIQNQIKQPIKQAFREVYILTDAEINTKSYSNRMAAHILKQHQFNSLAKSRGWKYSLLGAYDKGYSNTKAELYLPEKNLRAEFWVNELNMADQYNDTGIWLQIVTDQVRFIDIESGNTKDLAEISSIVFSEIMRDIDLFVGVASIGNDPSWRDNGGLPTERDYWNSYSFGNLSEFSKNRKSILENLIPRLKIASQSEIKDNFLYIKGRLRTYKIHLGSSNILMEPNDQYLCIVEDRNKKDLTTGVFLPFEGDSIFSLILSKAFLLAEDFKISDPTILSQILRK